MGESSARLRVGIAGYGVVGKRRHNFIDRHPLLKVVAVCDRTFSLDPRELGDGVSCHQHYGDLLAEPLDVLFVCLTNDVAAEVTVAGLERGLHVFCEKPPGRDVQDIVQVLDAHARRPDLRLKYGFNHRYHHSVREAIRIVGEGELGRVIDLKGTYGKSKLISFESDWRTKREFAGGGILLDQGIHMVDMMRLFAGDFSEVHSFISGDFWGHDVEDNAYVLMRSGTGVVAMLHSSATQWRHRFILEITLEKGAITLSGILSGTKSYGAEELTVVHSAPHDAGDPRESSFRYNEDPSWAAEIADFAHAITAGIPVVEGSGTDALKTMQLIYQIYCADPVWRQRFGLECVVPARWS